MRPISFHAQRLETSRLYQRRELAARRARDIARARAFSYLEEDDERIWIVDPEPRERDEAAR